MFNRRGLFDRASRFVAGIFGLSLTERPEKCLNNQAVDELPKPKVLLHPVKEGWTRDGFSVKSISLSSLDMECKVVYGRND